MSSNLLKTCLLLAAASVLGACSSGGGSSDSGSNDRDSNSLPNLQLDDGDVLGGGSSVVRIPAGDDTGIVRVGSEIVRQGNLPECAGLFDESIAATSLLTACLLDQPTCAVTFQPVDDVVEVIPPPLFAPIGIEYDVTLVDRDGSVTEPVRAVFCFDVGVNAPPVTAPDTYQLTYPSRIERTGVRYNDRCFKADGSQGVLANDEDDEHITNTCLRAELVELPTYASNLSSFGSTFGADGSFIYEAFGDLPAEDSSGVRIDTFTYRVTDGVNPASDPVQVEIVFADSANAAPVAENDSYTINEDAGVQELTVLNNDFDPDALPLSIIGISNGPGNGVANIRNGALIEYRPRADFIGQDNFTYTVQDSGGLTVTANVSINVVNVNDAPDARNDNVSTNKNESVVVQVLANDSDAENDALSVESVATPLHGTAVVTSENTIRYTPDFGYFGQDSFEYTISDGTDTATATVIVEVIFVNVVPVIGADQISVAEDTSVVFNLLDNDSDADADTLSIISVSDPSNGEVTLLSDGEVRYTPADGFSGSDSFSYVVSDGTAVATGQVSVSVNSVNDSPIANDDNASTDEDTAITVNVLSNDSDPDGDTLTVTRITNTSSGSATANDDNTVTFVPAESFSGTAGFSYEVDDGNGATDTADVSVSVNDTNDAPNASDDNASTSEDTAVVIDVLNNDSDPDGDNLTVASINNTRFGSASINDDNTITFTPADGFSGEAGFSYVVDDGNGGTDTASVVIVVSDTNEGPVAVDDIASTEEDDPVRVPVLRNDSDPDGDSLTLSVLTQPTNGSATEAQGDSVIYRPDTGFSGTDSFTYEISDGNGGVSTATVTVTVSSLNAAPSAQADAVQVSQGESVTIAVLSNDTDPDGDALIVSIDTGPSDGTATVQSDNTITYLSNATFAGTDTLIYSVADGNGGTDTATVTITVVAVIVNNPPSAVDDNAEAAQGTAVNFNVLANDSDPDGDDLTLSITTPPEHGSATVTGNNRIRYTPDAGYTGADSIVYTVDDGNGATDTATVSIQVVSSNSSPVAAADSAATTQGQAVTIDVVDNDSDPDGDTLTITAVSAAADGDADIDGGAVIYTPDAGFSGSDSFTYTISDGNGGEDTATVTVSVSAVNSAPVADVDSASTPQDTAVSIDVLANDSDADGDALSIASVSQASNGDTDIAAGEITYTPASGFSGTDSFTYTIEDGNGATAVATVTVTVTAVNAVPVATDDTATTDQELPVNISVLANDTDSDGDALTIDSFTQPLNGAVVDASGIFTYTPDTGFFGNDTFDYVVSDPDGATSSATVTVTVNEVITNSLPVAVDDAETTVEDVPVSIVVLANDSDPDGDALEVTAVTLAANGTASINSDGSIEYTPDAGFVGDDTFDYTIDDNVSGSANASVAITVTAAPATPISVNAAPEAFDDVETVSVGEVARIRVLTNDIDADGDNLTLALDVTLPPSIGTAEVHNNGRWINYTADVAGTDSFGYTIDDGNGGSDFAVVTVAVNDL